MRTEPQRQSAWRRLLAGLRPGSLRMRILAVFLLIIGLSFALTASRLTEYVSNYLFEQRIRQDSLSLERIALSAAPFFAAADTGSLNELLSDAGGELGGRLMAVDSDGKVQVDSFRRLTGVRLQLSELSQVLAGGRQVSYGIHRLSGGQEEMGAYVAYYAVAFDQGGALLYAAGVDEMMQSLSQVQRRLLMVFLMVAIAALAAAMLFSQIVTGPIVRLTDTIRRMGEGDLSVRVPVRGSGELRRLAESYNTMAGQLESLDKSRNQFVSDASHELKTPLTAIKSLLESVLYQEQMPREVQREFLSDIDHQIDRLTDIINDLLTLTRMDSGRLELHTERLCLSDGVKDTLHLLRTQAEQRGQLLIGRVTPDIYMEGDPSKLSQVFWNLVENALKYTPDNGRVEVVLTRKGNKAIFTVTDNGVGIPAENLPHVFERFYRVDKARSRDTGGTGLGLAIVKQLVTLHHGDISVESHYGQGSTFTVVLPL